MSGLSNRIGCVLGMLGTDVHTKGMRTVARMLSDAGVDVTLAGEHLTVEQLIDAVKDARPEFVGLSFSTAGYLASVRKFTDAMKAAGLEQIDIMVGGLVHPDDREALLDMGVSGLFGPGTTTHDILNWMSRKSAERTHAG